MRIFVRAFGFALLLTVPMSWVALAASGDVNYIKRSAVATLTSAQVTALVNFVGQIAPDVTAANAVAVSCTKQGSSVICQVQATATAAPTIYIADQLAGLVVSTTSTVP